MTPQRIPPSPGSFFPTPPSTSGPSMERCNINPRDGPTPPAVPTRSGKAKILFVTDYLRSKEGERPRPFDSRSQQLLDNIVKAMVASPGQASLEAIAKSVLSSGMGRGRGGKGGGLESVKWTKLTPLGPGTWSPWGPLPATLYCGKMLASRSCVAVFTSTPRGLVGIPKGRGERLKFFPSSTPTFWPSTPP